jgi:hypothetical protein
MMSPRSRFSRRRFLASAAGLVAGSGAVGAGLAGAASGRETLVPLGAQPAGLPPSQFAWAATLAKDAYGNAVSPRFDRLLFFDVLGTPSAADVRVLEAALRTLERDYAWGPGGLLFTVGWSPHYFEDVLGVATPLPRAKGLSDFELPTFDDYDLCVHLACDDEQRLAEIELGLVNGRKLSGGGSVNLSGVLRWRESRTGFVGTGLPAAHQDVNGIPAGNPVSATSPLYMGFKSGYTKNQATEADITITDGPFTGGTTMQVSYMRLRLDSWYSQLNDAQRVARMYAPNVTPAQVARFTNNPTMPSNVTEAATRYGVVGHAQTSARARVHGKPRIIRRDFDTADGGLAGLHFVSLQRTIADFVATRNAMNAANVQYANPEITDTVNNGINEFIFVLKRANYILPARATRAFPLAPVQASALA